MKVTTGRSQARHVADDTGIAGLYIVENEPLERLLFNRNRLGSDFRAVCLASVRGLVSHVADELTKDDYSELVMLSKGLMYQIQTALMLEADTSLPMNLMATTRTTVSGSAASIGVSYSRLDAGGNRLIIGDTVASGSTIVTALDRYSAQHELSSVIVMALAGAGTGAAHISQYCAGRGIECRLLFGLAVFGLGTNGFDLSFLHPETVCAERFRERASKQFSGKPVSAVGWDFGSQAMAPEKYRELCWLEAEAFDLHGHPALACESRPRSLVNLVHERAAFENFTPG